MAQRSKSAEGAVTALILGTGAALVGLVGLLAGAPVAGAAFLVSGAVLVGAGLVIRTLRGSGDRNPL